MIFIEKKVKNKLVLKVLGLFTLTSMYYWQPIHENIPTGSHNRLECTFWTFRITFFVHNTVAVYEHTLAAGNNPLGTFCVEDGYCDFYGFK